MKMSCMTGVGAVTQVKVSCWRCVVLLVLMGGCVCHYERVCVFLRLQMDGIPRMPCMCHAAALAALGAASVYVMLIMMMMIATL